MAESKFRGIYGKAIPAPPSLTAPEAGLVPPSKVKAKPRESKNMRCSVCHDDGSGLMFCKCGTALHASCMVEFGCPSCGERDEIKPKKDSLVTQIGPGHYQIANFAKDQQRRVRERHAAYQRAQVGREDPEPGCVMDPEGTLCSEPETCSTHNEFGGRLVPTPRADSPVTISEGAVLLGIFVSLGVSVFLLLVAFAS